MVSGLSMTPFVVVVRGRSRLSCRNYLLTCLPSDVEEAQSVEGGAIAGLCVAAVGDGDGGGEGRRMEKTAALLVSTHTHTHYRRLFSLMIGHYAIMGGSDAGPLFWHGAKPVWGRPGYHGQPCEVHRSFSTSRLPHHETNIRRIPPRTLTLFNEDCIIID